ncbi:MAG: DUF370 domain-containing protein [Oscillospiraceae bacterium]|jgi:hypothetical protein|nr:DUF370 domain-containing protein [Oscillospiraceae bacterium]
MKMFCLGPGAMLPRDAVVGIFDLDTATVSGHTRDFLRRAQESGAVATVGDELPQSFIVSRIAPSALVGESAVDCIYLLPQSSANLSKKFLTIP